MKTRLTLLSQGSLLFLGFFLLYFGWSYRLDIRQYQLPVSLLIASTVFMKVIAGNTIPLWIVVAVLGVFVFLVQEGVSYREYQSSEVMRQIMLSGVIFSTFLIYAYVFGSIFINSLGPVWLGIVCLLSTVNVASFTFYMYRIPYGGAISSLIGICTMQVFIGLRVMPYGHLTLASLLTIFTFFSMMMFRDWLSDRMKFKNLITKICVMGIMVGVIIVTAQISVV